MSDHHHTGRNEGARRGGGGGLGLEKAVSEVLPEAQVNRIENEVGEPLANAAVEGIVGTIQDLLEPGKKAGGHGSGRGGAHKSH